MTFDIIIGNPPYQKNNTDGSTAEGAMPLYNEFVDKAIELNPKYISMIIPSRWMTGGKQILNDFRQRLIESKHLAKIVHYPKQSDVFQYNAEIAGGVQYFLYDNTKEFNMTEIVNIINNEENIASRDISKYRYTDEDSKTKYIIINDNTSSSILDKVINMTHSFVDEIVSTMRPFGIDTSFSDSDIETVNKNIKVHCSNNKITYTDILSIKDDLGILHNIKVIAGRTNPDRGGVNNSDSYNVINKPKIINTNEICTMTYIVLFSSEDKEECEHFYKYIKTKFARFLIYLTLSGISVTRGNYRFVPMQDFKDTSDIKWDESIDNINKQLYSKYKLNNDEINHIEKIIKTMN